MKPFTFTFILVTVCYVTSFCQIPNADFEDWELAPNGGEVPAMWNSPYSNQPDAIFKSSDSFSGDYSLGMATLNYQEGTLSPSFFGIKIKPTSLENTLTFYYKIDSLVGNGNAKVWVLKEKEDGGSELLYDFGFNEVNQSFIKEQVSFTLPDLDSVIVTFVSANQQTSTGWTGFTRAFFDSVELNTVTLAVDQSPKGELVAFPNPANGFFEVKNLNQNHEFLEIISPAGQTIYEGKVEYRSYPIESTGFFLVNVYNRNRELLKTLKVFNF